MPSSGFTSRCQGYRRTARVTSSSVRRRHLQQLCEGVELLREEPGVCGRRRPQLARNPLGRPMLT